MATLYSLALTSNSPGWQGYSLRQLLGATGVASAGQVRVTFTASLAAGMTVDHASIAVKGAATFPNCTAVPTELKFSGASGFALSAGQTIVSDWLTFTAETTDQLVIIMDFNAGVASAARSATDATADYQFKTGSASYADNSVTGYTSGGTASYYALVETQAIPPSGGTTSMMGV